MKNEGVAFLVILALSLSISMTSLPLLSEERVKTSGISQNNVLTAQELRIVDSEGRTRISLRGAVIEILDEDGQVIWKAPPFDWSEGNAFASPEPYTRIGGNHWVQTVLYQGRIVILEDGSHWEIDIRNQAETVLWAPTSPITVVEADSPAEDFQYILTNTEEDQSVPARYRGR